MGRTEAFLFGTDPVGVYAFQEALTFTDGDPEEMAIKPLWYGKQDGSGDETSEAFYVEPEKLHTQNAPGIRSLDDIGRMIVVAFHNLDQRRDAVGVVQLARSDNPIAFDFGPSIPFTVGNVSTTDTGTGPIITTIDNPLPTDFAQVSAGGDVNDQLFCRPVVTFTGTDGTALTSVSVLLVSGSGAATQAFPHRGVVDSARRYW